MTYAERPPISLATSICAAAIGSGFLAVPILAVWANILIGGDFSINFYSLNMLFWLEWVTFGLSNLAVSVMLSFGWAPKLRFLYVGIYLVVLLVNISLMFGGGFCIDQYGNIYAPGVFVYGGHLCIPQLD